VLPPQPSFSSYGSFRSGGCDHLTDGPADPFRWPVAAVSSESPESAAFGVGMGYESMKAGSKRLGVALTLERHPKLGAVERRAVEAWRLLPPS
jgi:hypothetical protein